MPSLPDLPVVPWVAWTWALLQRKLGLPPQQAAMPGKALTCLASVEMQALQVLDALSQQAEPIATGYSCSCAKTGLFCCFSSGEAARGLAGWCSRHRNTPARTHSFAWLRSSVLERWRHEPGRA
ncbi:unnamed protein product [Symbiodinium natans]|uniref:Uncharacterized protein n=1 Tax=Symbiodinium natans TaxID=878477 RepID=A0A812TKZ2_9DINO|nr:unnamed protein product [Symbiodinium natans]